MQLKLLFCPNISEGYQQILPSGDMLSKFVSAIQLKKQTATSLKDVVLKHWHYIHSTAVYLLSDQGSSVDGETVKTLCNKQF